MGMAVGKKGGLQSDMNVTPLVDVLLVLLIIFMVMTPLALRGYDVQIPRDTNQPVPVTDQTQFIMSISEADCPITAPLGNQGLPPGCTVRINKEVVRVDALTQKAEEIFKNRKKEEKILFPIVGFIVTTLVAPGAIPLLGMLFFGNVLRESGVTTRLAKTGSSALIDICTMLLGLAVGASTSAQVFLKPQSIMIFALGCVAFAFSTAGGVLFAKLMNLFLKEKINPLIGSAGVSAVPDAARVSESFRKHMQGQNLPAYLYSLTTKDGRRIEALLSSRLIPYEGEQAILGTVVDITERVKIEEALRRAPVR